MRLIDVATFKLVEYHDESKLPPYAILSHTWGDSEVTFEQFQKFQNSNFLIRHRMKKGSGHRKIAKACQQASRDGYQYLWVDTCCIDKTSSAELSEAINSMFRWYKGSGVCYAYLDDVEAGDSKLIDEAKLAEAKWFTRGWTLQELIAPRRIHFYGKDWRFMGNSHALGYMLSRITGIGYTLLVSESRHLYPHSIAERMSWMASRQTTRVEDIAYSMLGIFNVNMPLLYGEGDKAFIRLQEEIMKGSRDQTLFAWTSQSKNCHPEISRRYDVSLLAPHPNCFGNSRFRPKPFYTAHEEPYTLTNHGLRIVVPMLPIPEDWPIENQERNHYALAVLNCKHIEINLQEKRVAVLIRRRPFSGSIYDRVECTHLITVPEEIAKGAPLLTIYLSKSEWA